MTSLNLDINNHGIKVATFNINVHNSKIIPFSFEAFNAASLLIDFYNGQLNKPESISLEVAVKDLGFGVCDYTIKLVGSVLPGEISLWYSTSKSDEFYFFIVRTYARDGEYSVQVTNPLPGETVKVFAKFRNMSEITTSNYEQVTWSSLET